MGKRAGRPGRALTQGEVRLEVAEAMAEKARIWARARAPDSLAERLDETAHALFVLFDGGPSELCPMAFAPIARLEGRRGEGCRIDQGLSAEVERLLATRGLGELAVAFGGLAAGPGSGSAIASPEAEPFFARMFAASVRWAEWAAPKGAQGELAAREGLALSFACLVEGRCEGFSGFAVACAPRPEGEGCSRDEGDNWHRPLPKDDPVAEMDASGSWAMAWAREWGTLGIRAATVRATLAALEEAKILQASVGPVSRGQNGGRM